MIDSLIKLANELDKRGYQKEADQIDGLIKKNAGRHELFRALKNNDVDGAVKSLVGMNNEDLGLTSDEFRELTKDLSNAKLKQNEGDPEIRDNFMDQARDVLGIEKPVQQSTQTHNPITGLPWSSGPVEDWNMPVKSPRELNDWEKDWLNRQLADRGQIGRKINSVSD